jgi:hypothetical protein
MASKTFLILRSGAVKPRRVSKDAPAFDPAAAA